MLNPLIPSEQFSKRTFVDSPIIDVRSKLAYTCLSKNELFGVFGKLDELGYKSDQCVSGSFKAVGNTYVIKFDDGLELDVSKDTISRDTYSFEYDSIENRDMFENNVFVKFKMPDFKNRLCQYLIENISCIHRSSVLGLVDAFLTNGKPYGESIRFYREFNKFILDVNGVNKERSHDVEFIPIDVSEVVALPNKEDSPSETEIPKISILDFENKILKLENILIVVRAPSNLMVDDFNHLRKSNGAMTVQVWLESKIYPLVNGHQVDVISGGYVAPHPLTTLTKLRNSYIV